MDLEKYIKSRKISYRKFAKLVGINHAAIFRYAKKTSTPSLKIAIKINEVTKGVVPMASLICD